MKYPGRKLLGIITAGSVLFSSGSLQALAAGTGWMKEGSGSWIYINLAGQQLKSSWLDDGGQKYCFDENGHMRRGWYQEKGHWYYFDNAGLAKTRWLKKDGKWYAFNKEAQMVTGWFKDTNGQWYYLNPSNGAMLTGWLTEGNKTYYLDNSGAMKTGWLKKDGYWYYLQKDGALLKNSWIDSTDEKGTPCRVYLDGTGKWTDTDYSNNPSKPEPEQKPVQNPKPEQKPQPEQKPEQKPVQKPDPNPVQKPEPEKKPDPNPVQKPNPVPEPEPQPEPEPEPVPEPQPEPDPDPVKKYLPPVLSAVKKEKVLSNKGEEMVRFSVEITNPNPDCYLSGVFVDGALFDKDGNKVDSGDPFYKELIQYYRDIKPLETLILDYFLDPNEVDRIDFKFNHLENMEYVPSNEVDLSVGDNIIISNIIYEHTTFGQGSTYQLKFDVTNNNNFDFEPLKYHVNFLKNGKIICSQYLGSYSPANKTVTFDGPFYKVKLDFDEIKIEPRFVNRNLNWYPM